MAITGFSALTDSNYAALVESQVVLELRPANTSREFLRFAAKGPSNVANFPLYGDVGPSVSFTDDVTDYTTVTAMSDTAVAATAAENGLRIDVSDLVRATHVQNIVADAAAMLVRSNAEKWEADLAALMDDFSNVTTAASTFTPVDLLSAVSALEQRDIPGPYVGYFDPKQTGELRNEIATTTASYQVGDSSNAMVKPFEVSGFWGNYMGIPIYQTSLVVTTSGLVGGAVFASKQALGAYEIWSSRVETQRDASFRSLELIGSQCYGFCEISDTRGQTVKSVA